MRNAANLMRSASVNQTQKGVESVHAVRADDEWVDIEFQNLTLSRQIGNSQQHVAYRAAVERRLPPPPVEQRRDT